MSMFFGMSGVDVWCCLSCNTPAPDFRGSYWGVVDNYLTRLPEYILSADYLTLASEPYYTPLKYKPHPTLSAALPNLTDADDVERYCFGAAWSMMADGSALSTGGGGEYVWAGCHYVPVGENDLTNAVAALCLCKVSSFTEGVATAEIGTPTVWLINDAAGDPLVFNSPTYMDIHTSDRKAFCGPGYFGWFDKRTTGGTENKITYYTASQATPSVLSWANTAQTISAGNYYNVVEVSRNSFPLALGCWSDESVFGDTTREKVDRYYQIGEFDTSNGRLAKPDTIPDDEWDLAAPPFITLNNSTANGFETTRGREDDTAPEGDDAHFSDVFLDWAVFGSVWIDPGETEEDPGTTFFVLGDSSLVNRAEGPDTLADGLANWRAEFRSLASATTLVAVSGLVDSGSSDWVRDGMTDLPVGYLRLSEAYGYHNQNGVDNPYSTSMIMRYRDSTTLFDYVGWRAGAVTDGAIDAEVTRATDIDPLTTYTFDSFEGRYNYLRTGDFDEEDNLSQWAVVRIPRKLGGGYAGEYHYYVVGSSNNNSGRTWPEVDDDSTGDERNPVEFANVGSAIGPPTGFYETWEDDVRTVHRRPFAVQGQYDDHHPILHTD